MRLKRSLLGQTSHESERSLRCTGKTTRQINIPYEMPFFNKSKKKLEEERQQRQKLEKELAERKRKENLREEEMRQARRREIIQREQMQKAHQREMEQAEEKERQRRQRLEERLAEQERTERIQREQLQVAHQREIEQAEQQLRNTRLAQEELNRREEERQTSDRWKKGLEEKRLEREARQRQERQRKIEEASPETLRSLRELIRLRYQLDVEIWGLRGARKPDHWLVEQKMEKADAVLEEIMAMVKVWEHDADGSWDAAEWERVQDIRRRLLTGGVRIWADSPLLWSEGRGVADIGARTRFRQGSIAT